MNKISRQNELIEIARSEEVKKVIEDGLKLFDPDALTSDGIIQSYKINYEDTEKNPMGGIIIIIIVNDNVKYDMTFFINQDSQTGQLVYTGGSHSPELQNLLESEGLGQ